MANDLSELKALIAKLQSVASAPQSVKQLIRRWQNGVNTYVSLFSPPSLDLPTWTARYQAAFVAADSAARWGLGAATLSTPGPSGASVPFDVTSGAHSALAASLAASLAALAAPTNGQADLSDVIAFVTAARDNFENLWSALPTYNAAETVAANLLASLVWEARTVVRSLGLVKTTGVTLTFNGAAHTISRSKGSWLADLFVVGDSITIAGTTLNNGTNTIAGLTDQVMTFALGLADEKSVGGATVAVTG